MKNILAIALSIIKKNVKLHIFLVIIFLTCLVGLITSLSILQTTANTFDANAEELKAADMFRVMSATNADITKIKDYLNNDSDVENYQLQPCTSPYTGLRLNGHDEVTSIIIESPENRKLDQIKIIDGEKTSQPGIDEIWILYGFANNYKINVGDTIELAGIDGKSSYKVSAIVYDPYFISGLANPTRMWVKNGQLSLSYGLTDMKYYALSIRFKSRDIVAQSINKFDEAFPDLNFPTSVTFDTMKNISSMLTNYISYGLLFTSLLIMIICLALIFFIVTGEIVRDYHIYGIYKSLGFSTFTIKSIIGFKYIILLMISYPFAIITSFFSTKFILDLYERTTGAGLLQPKLLFPSIISIGVLCITIFIAVLISTKKLNKLKPANAIRFGYQSKTTRLDLNMSNLSPIKLLTFKELLTNPLRNIIKILTITGLTTLVLSLSIVSIIMPTLFTPEFTMGLPKCEVFLQSNGEQNLDFILYDLSKDKSIEKYSSAIASMNNYYSKNGTRISLLGYGYDSYDDLSVVQGRNPKYADEVAITPIISKLTGKNIGDIININIEGTTQNLTITGLYQTLSYSGNAFRILKETFKKSNPEIKENWVALSLNKDYKPEVIKDKLISQFGSKVTVNTYAKFLENTTGGINKGMAALFITLIIITAFICSLSLYNLLMIHMIENRKSYGILKSVGMSYKELLTVQILKTTILTSISCIIAIILSKSLVPRILVGFLSSLGINEISSNILC